MDENALLSDDKIIDIGNIQTLSETIDWGLIDFSIPKLWEVNKGDEITVLVADTGISEHEDLKDNILFDKAMSCVENEDINDLRGHGTMVAGIISAKDSNFGIVGVAPHTKIIPVKVFNKNGGSSMQHIEKMLNYAYNIKPDIINLSFGTFNKLSKRCEYYIDKITNELNIPIICAMGNYGEKNACYPARYPDTFAVTSYKKDRLISDFSSRDNRAEFALPGEDILTTTLNNQYAIVNGTSFSAPFLSGIIAIILSFAKKNNKSLKVQTIKTLLINCSKDYGPLGRDNLYGYGIINSNSLLTLLNSYLNNQKP